MADVEEIVDYMKSLKKGFDKELFQSKINELGFLVENNDLNYEDFNTLFKVWLNLSIPISKWVSLGSCLVPQEKINQITVEYSLRWILASFENQNNFNRIAFLLDWLTAAMDSDSIDMNALDMGYELFYIMLTYEILSVHAIKLVYKLTKPADVTRKRALELIDYAKKREAKKNMYRQIQVLLGLFKSYKPELVPEDVPSMSIYTAFRKINMTLLTRFKHSQSHRHSVSRETFQLFWVNPINSVSGRNKKAEPLVPNMEFANIGSKQYNNNSQKNYLEFSDPVSLLQYSSQSGLSRPVRLRAMLLNPAGLALLAALPAHHAFLSLDLHHLLAYCFLETSPHSYAEKQDLLHRLALFQSTVLQGLPIITRFLAQFLPFWNEKDYFAEILELIEWVDVEGTGNISVILDIFSKIYYRARPLEQCAIMRSVTAMYCNLILSGTRSNHHFLNMRPDEDTFTQTISTVALKINDICNGGMQISPDDLRLLCCTLRGAEARARASLGPSGSPSGSPAGSPAGSPTRSPAPPPSVLVLALPLLAPSAACLDNMASIIMLYKQIYSNMKVSNGPQYRQCEEHRRVLKSYTADFVSCFYEKFLSNRSRGIVFGRLHPQLVNKLIDKIPGTDSQLSIRNHLAFAPYTDVHLQAVDHRHAGNKLWFDAVIDKEFTNLGRFIVEAIPDL